MYQTSLGLRLGVVFVISLMVSSVGFSAEIVQANGASIEESTNSFTGVGFADVVGLSASLNLAEPGKVMVISTFTSRTDSVFVEGQWRLSDGATDSQEVGRYMTNTTDQGIGMVVNIFDGSAGSNTYALQHSSGSATKDIITEDGNISMFSLNSYNSETLNSNQTVVSGAVPVDSTTFVPVASGTLTLEKTGHVFLAASYSTRIDTAKVIDSNTGQWQLQIDTDPTSGTTWVNVGEGTERFMSGTNDTGASMLMGIYDTGDLAAGGDYEYRLLAAQKVTKASAPIFTEGITLSAMELTYSNGDVMPHDTDSVATADSNASTTYEHVTDLEATLTVAAGEGVFVGTSFTTYSDQVIATFVGALNVEDSLDVDVLTSKHLERDMSGADDLGSGALSGIGELSASGTYDAYMLFRALDAGDTVWVDNPTMVFLGGMDVVPEPATMSLLALGGIALLRRKRR